MKIINNIFLVLYLSGCSLLNPIIGYERTFKNHVNNYIGKPLSVLDDEIYSGHWKPQGKNTINTNYIEHMFLLKYSPVHGEVECIWAAKVNNETNLIESWRYISHPSQCDWPYFYEGAW